MKNKNDDEKFYSTCFELIVSYIFRKIGGYTLEPHPQLPHSNKRPDFLVRTPDGDSFYLELVTVGELDNSQIIRIKEYIKKFKHTLNGENKTIIHIRNVEGRELSHENITELHNEIPKWWNKNKQNIGAQFIKSFDRSLICLEIVFEDSLRLESIIDITNFHNKLLDSLEKKATRYGKLNLPFMIATTFRPSNFSAGLFLQENIIAASLYGGSIWNVEKTKWEDYSFWATFKERKRNNHVGGVLYFDSLIPENLESFEYVLFLNHHVDDDKELPKDLRDFLPYYYVIDKDNAKRDSRYLRELKRITVTGKLI